jgi:hypothetical protein
MAAARGIGWAVDKSGRPFKVLPEVGKFFPFADIPGPVGRAAQAVEGYLPAVQARAVAAVRAIAGITPETEPWSGRPVASGS